MVMTQAPMTLAGAVVPIIGMGMTKIGTPRLASSMLASVMAGSLLQRRDGAVDDREDRPLPQ